MVLHDISGMVYNIWITKQELWSFQFHPTPRPRGGRILARRSSSSWGSCIVSPRAVQLHCARKPRRARKCESVDCERRKCSTRKWLHNVVAFAWRFDEFQLNPLSRPNVRTESNGEVWGSKNGWPSKMHVETHITDYDYEFKVNETSFWKEWYYLEP